jgi:hypothetical protein
LCLALLLPVVGAAFGPAACSPQRAVSLKVAVSPQTPNDASVTIDEQFVGLLGYVAARGVRLPAGEHRITVEREGYFPWDRIVVSDRQEIHLEVVLVRIPD